VPQRCGGRTLHRELQIARVSRLHDDLLPDHLPGHLMREAINGAISYQSSVIGSSAGHLMRGAINGVVNQSSVISHQIICQVTASALAFAMPSRSHVSCCGPSISRPADTRAACQLALSVANWSSTSGMLVQSAGSCAATIAATWAAAVHLWGRG